MTEEMRRSLDELLPSALPPAPWELAELETRARRRTRNRWIGAASAGLAVAAVVALVVPLAWSGFHTATPPGKERFEQPEFTLPDLDDDEYYHWGDDESTEQTKATKEITKAFWAHMKETYDGLELYREDDLASAAPVGEVDPQPIVRVDNELWTDPDAEHNGSDETFDKDDYIEPEKIHEQPLYTLWPGAEGTYSEFRFAGSDHGDDLTVKVHPKGGFVEGVPDDPRPQPGKYPPHPQYLVENCGKFSWNKSGPVDVEVDCRERTVSTGRVLIAERVDTSEHGSITQRTVVLYREDGTAVVVEDVPFKPDAHEMSASLDADALIAIAQAIPETVVQ